MSEWKFMAIKVLIGTGIVMVLDNHINLAWWEGLILSAGIMIFWGQPRS